MYSGHLCNRRLIQLALLASLLIVNAHAWSAQTLTCSIGLTLVPHTWTLTDIGESSKAKKLDETLSDSTNADADLPEQSDDLSAEEIYLPQEWFHDSTEKEESEKRARFIPRFGKRGFIPRFGKRGFIPRFGKRGFIPRFGKRGFIPRFGKRNFIPRFGKRAFIPRFGKRAFIPRFGKRAFIPRFGKRAFIPRFGKRED